jgi:hypothetical protein
VLVKRAGAWALGEGVASDLKGQRLSTGLGQVLAPLGFGFFDGKAALVGVHGGSLCFKMSS